MKKFRYIFVISLFILFIPRVYAFSYDINTIPDISVEKGTALEVNVSIDNIKDTTDGVSVCSMNILFDKNIVLESSIRTLGNWSMTTGSMYLFDTGSPILTNSNIFTIPVVVNGEGSIQLNNILCSDGIEEVEVSNKKINFYILDEVNNDNQNNSNNTTGDNGDELETSNCNLSDIELSEGTIEFDPNVTEYEVEVADFDQFRVTPKLEDSTSSYVIDRNITDDGGNVVITVNGDNGDFKTYVIYVSVSDTITEDPPKENNYIPIFIGIIVLLVLINVIRIVKNVKKK